MSTRAKITNRLSRPLLLGLALPLFAVAGCGDSTSTPALTVTNLSESADSWVELDIPMDVESVRWNQLGFLAIPKRPDDAKPWVISHSADGVVWNEVPLLDITGEAELRRPLFPRIHARSNSYILSADRHIWESEDGLKWERTFTPDNELHGPFVFGSADRVLALEMGQGPPTIAASRSTGAWADDVSEISHSTIALDAAVGSNSVVVAGQRFSPVNTDTGPEIFHSLRGQDLRAVDLPPSMEQPVFQIALNDATGEYVAITSKTGEVPRAYASADGTTWSFVSTFESDDGLKTFFEWALLKQQLISTPDGFVAFGSTSEGASAYWSSPDGLSWTFTPFFEDLTSLGQPSVHQPLPGECLLGIGDRFFYGPCAEAPGLRAD